MGSSLPTSSDSDRPLREASHRALDSRLAARQENLRKLSAQLSTLSQQIRTLPAARDEALAGVLSVFQWQDRLKAAASQTVLDMHAAVSAWEAAGGPAAEAADRIARPSVHAAFCTAAAISFAAAVESGRWEIAAWLRDHFGAAVHLKGAVIETALEGRKPALLRELVARGFVDRVCPDFAGSVLQAALDVGDLDSALILFARAGLCPAGTRPLLPRLQAAVLARQASAAEFEAMATEVLLISPDSK